ncbi:MAG: hypothetical protein LBO65_09615 [Spirochaetaceae bacterium]|jgi:hypothetical protein|nr:hypothetical protein [Spirochaetaceae bacterium]
MTDKTGMVEMLTLGFTAVSAAIALYAVVVQRIAERKRREQEWQRQYRDLKDETARNLECLAALGRENLNDNAIRESSVQLLIGQLRTVRLAAVSAGFFLPLQKRRAAKNRPALDPAEIFSAVRDAVRKIDAVKDRAERAEEITPNSPRTLLSPRIAAIRRRLELVADALSGP